MKAFPSIKEISFHPLYPWLLKDVQLYSHNCMGRHSAIDTRTKGDRWMNLQAYKSNWTYGWLKFLVSLCLHDEAWSLPHFPIPSKYRSYKTWLHITCKSPILFMAKLPCLKWTLSLEIKHRKNALISASKVNKVQGRKLQLSKTKSFL